MADGPPEEKPQDAPSIPEVLTLSTFFKSDKLCDCTVKLPDVENSLAEETKGDVQKDDEQTGEPKLREWRCHKVVLASASNWFYKQFVSEGKEEVVIPELPDDPVVRRTVILEDLIPLALRYMYAGQSWDEIFPEVLDPQGLFVVACTLEVRNLANKVLSYISDEILDDEHMMELLYQGVQLGKEGEELVSKAAEAIRGNFSHVCANAADCDLFTKLPVEVIERLLEGDDLQVKNEEEVFRVVQHTLRRRLKRQERLLIMQDIGVSEGEHFSDVTLELTASETLHALGQEEAPKPDVPKYSVKSDPIKVEGKGHCTFADCTLRLRIPSASTSTPKIAFRVVQDGKVVAEVVLPDEVCDDDKAPAEAQPSLTGDTTAPDARKENAEATPGLFKCALAMGIQAFGQVTFRRTFEDLSEEDAANDVVLTTEETNKLLQCVRFPHLNHDVLVEASKDGVMLESGAQPLIVQAFSSRLSAYEPGGETDSRPARPSTVGGVRKCPPQRPKTQCKGPVSPTGKDVVAGRVEHNATLTFDHTRDFDEHGLLYFLATKGHEIAWRNPHGAGQVVVMSSGVGFGTLQDLVGRQIVNLRTTNEKNSWFGVDLGVDRRFACTGYCLRNRNAISHYLRHWDFEASVDAEKWDVLHSRADEKGLRLASATAYFEVPITPRSESGFRYFRVRQVGKNSSGSYNLVLSGIEFYGSVVQGSFP